ncbi:acyl-CoA thioesterase [Thalassococcus sp. S3]|uniref:acyl-CoA thioesterase n=1 Tax=Thalassococcus sp. S3 TaxID=2017482 RepID=UPI001023F617|nr:acyl-CoA thioesterase [Thalassococcus sp. S3]QBF29818.1 thioeseterase [Thalassococcus sp. S3]
MFPFIRFAKDLLLARRMPPLERLTDVHVSHHICWPWDLDMFMELNNGRMLTLYDLGRFMTAQRGGLIKALFDNGWALTMAGASVRYRRRITGFERFEMRSRAVCWDERFVYLEQSMWKRNGDCASHVLYRAAVIDKRRAVPPTRVLEAMGQDPQSPPIPGWIAAWIEAESQRPWPPMTQE